MATKMRESDLSKEVAKRLDFLIKCNYPIFYYKTHGWIYQRIGLPDYILCYNGKFVACELKVGNNVLSTAQQLIMLRLMKCGALCYGIVSIEEFNEMMLDLHSKVP